jgi:D-glycero-alpha-D-manno-heptose-7-phosphate kinase
MSIQKPHNVTAIAPVRVCDVGGWTDTWFARTGYVCSIAINRIVSVTISVKPAHSPTITFDIRNYQQVLSLDETRIYHPLLAVALAEIPVATGYSYAITIDADMPPGSSTGTSAAVSVALLAALSACNGQTLSATELAHRAHRLETVHLGQQSGVQDQIGAAYGGANFITITNYPDTIVQHIDVSTEFIQRFNQQHTLFYYGKPHRSTDIHQQVINRMTHDHTAADALEPMRRAALVASHALMTNNLATFADALQLNTLAQSTLHPELVSDTAHHIITIAKQYDAWGWKVNGAGGDGGSISIIASDSPTKHKAMIAHLAQELPHIVHIDSAFCTHGVRVSIDNDH